VLVAGAAGAVSGAVSGTAGVSSLDAITYKVELDKKKKEEVRARSMNVEEERLCGEVKLVGGCEESEGAYAKTCTGHRRLPRTYHVYSTAFRDILCRLPTIQ
jgi:hypothetical protein